MMYKTANGQNKEKIFKLMDETSPNRQNDIFNSSEDAATMLTTTSILEKYLKFMDYDGELDHGRAKKNLTKVQKIIRHSTSGRKIKTPKALLPTSSDEALRKNKLSVGLSAYIKDHIRKLKGSLNVIQTNQLGVKRTIGSKTSNFTSKTNNPSSKHKQASTTKPSCSAKKLHKNNTDKTVLESPLSEEQLLLSKPKPSLLISKSSGKDLYEQNADVTISDSFVTEDQLSQLEISVPSSSRIEGLALSSKNCRLMTRNQLHLSNWEDDVDVQEQKENFHKDFADFRKRVENSLLNLKNQGEELDETVENLIRESTKKILKLLTQRSTGRKKLTPNLYRNPEGFPLSSIKQFYQLEQNEDKLTELKIDKFTA